MISTLSGNTPSLSEVQPGNIIERSATQKVRGSRQGALKLNIWVLKHPTFAIGEAPMQWSWGVPSFVLSRETKVSSKAGP